MVVQLHLFDLPKGLIDIGNDSWCGFASCCVCRCCYFLRHMQTRLRAMDEGRVYAPAFPNNARARAKGTVVKRHLLPLRAGKTTAQASKACVVVGASSSGRAVISGRPVLRAPALQVARGRAIHNPPRTTEDYMLCAFARLLTIGITAVD